MSSAIKIVQGDCLEKLKKIPSNSISAIVTDPPYGLSNTKPAQVADVLKAWVTGDTTVVPAKKGGFMGKDWDSFVPPPAVWEECMRVLKPGGHMAVFAGARTQDLMGLSIRLAGFEIRDTLGWIYGSGFPKSHNISKAIDKAAGAEREVKLLPTAATAYSASAGNHRPWMDEAAENGGMRVVAGDTPVTDDAARWNGWGTALKPAIEPVILARKPPVGTVAQNVLAHGVGGLNIDACRVEAHDKAKFPAGVVSDTETVYGGGGGMYSDKPRPVDRNPSGRFPANVLLDEHAAAEMDEQSGVSVSRRAVMAVKGSNGSDGLYGEYSTSERKEMGHNDSGGASRFFPVFKYQAKAPKKERPMIVREDGTKVQHPTVKPVALMEWLVTLITPPGGVVLDPFAGTGTTLEAAKNEGFKVIGIERDPDYIQLINQRLNH
ncbi:hypothetical protein KIMCHI1738_46 [Corynebacterium phage Kimchi1738]|uniref:DNA methylase N-4/N-6 domain-containing protein n=1 Tax=Corynebacterium phage Kimchi1738 TaxID=2483719 RepID=A0A3G3LWL3_9CAUD|nr:DNA methyltransferase [Corynebacterium phage Kimchi1738]AYQ98437.1 hypothetical protein KIMCHI1738_46 [Corynebacterium phage Kimchi1738]